VRIDLEKALAADLDAWRQHPTTELVMRAIEQKRLERLADLKNAAIDASIDRVRRLGGNVEGIEDVQKLMRTKGAEDR